MVDTMEYFNKGSIEMIVGPMYAGKSEELIRRITRAQIAGLKVVALKPKLDDRYSLNHIISHNGKQRDCIVVDKVEEIEKLIKEEDFDVLAIDEVQFLGTEIIELCQRVADMGKRVICSGLDMDFRAEPFYNVAHLIAIAEHVTKLTAICMVCKLPASRTQRLVNGRPAKYTDPIIMVGAKESYEARCRSCHKVEKD